MKGDVIMPRPLHQKKHMIDLIFSLALFCVFAATSLIVVIIGADVYSRIAAGMNHGFETRTSLVYVSEKIRQNDTDGAVRVGDVEGIPALVLDQTYGAAVYCTYIYYYDGALREIFASVDIPVKPTDGQRITELSDFSVEQIHPGIYKITSVGTDGKERSVVCAPRST